MVEGPQKGKTTGVTKVEPTKGVVTGRGRPIRPGQDLRESVVQSADKELARLRGIMREKLKKRIKERNKKAKARAGYENPMPSRQRLDKMVSASQSRLRAETKARAIQELKTQKEAPARWWSAGKKRKDVDELRRETLKEQDRRMVAKAETKAKAPAPVPGKARRFKKKGRVTPPPVPESARVPGDTKALDTLKSPRRPIRLADRLKASGRAKKRKSPPMEDGFEAVRRMRGRGEEELDWSVRRRLASPGHRNI
jgi:hypothetical protein